MQRSRLDAGHFMPHSLAKAEVIPMSVVSFFLLQMETL